MDGQNPFRTTLKPWLNPLLVDIYREIESETRVSEFGGAKWMSSFGGKSSCRRKTQKKMTRPARCSARGADDLLYSDRPSEPQHKVPYGSIPGRLQSVRHPRRNSRRKLYGSTVREGARAEMNLSGKCELGSTGKDEAQRIDVGLRTGLLVWCQTS